VSGINAFGIEALLILSGLLQLLGRGEIPVSLSVCPSILKVDGIDTKV